MTGIREVLAANLREYRRRLGLTQEQFAEKADVSTHYVAMIETCKKYPKPEMVERLAKALDVEPLQLFSATTPSNEPIERLIQQSITDIKKEITDLKQVVIQTIEKNLPHEYRGKDKA